MGLTRVQTTAGFGESGIVSATWLSGATAQGNLIVLAVGSRAASGISVITPPSGVGYVLAAAANNDVTYWIRNEIHYLADAAPQSGTGTFSSDFGGSASGFVQGMALVATEYTGPMRSGFIVDALASGFSVSGALSTTNLPFTGTAASGNQGYELVIGSICTGKASGYSNPTGGFSLVNQVANVNVVGGCRVGFLEQFAQSIGSYSGGVTAGASGQFAGCIATFRPAVPMGKAAVN